VEPDPTAPVRLGGEPTEPAPEQRVGLAADDPLNAVDEPGFGPYGFGYDDPVPPFDATDFVTATATDDGDDDDSDDLDDDDEADDHVHDRRSALAGV
ncbi:MAG: hypothetical protein HOU01_09870, partial [Streptomycetaceae bacterium]|nr:hypothetical protein [Streptomycetaceae bacterium]